ncbi:ATP-binding protein [Streptomyces sp. NBC_00690]|uniref:ATP-binding protein n=1 Tax=Streptomyces sp. NBC_00690 TaxID=2975808 RepID=UPI002E299393|nr:ATP-binding protein [Streptomyces sp. NBC_00690]
MNQRIAQLGSPTARFSVVLSPTPRGARLARRLVTERLDSWGLSDQVAENAAHIVAELAANAVTHGRVAGRDFLLGLHTTGGDRPALRIEVTDTHTGRIPGTSPLAPEPESESGRGLLLVEAFADRWGVKLGPVPRKTVWAELNLAPDQCPSPEHVQSGSGGTGALLQGTEEKKEPHPTPPPFSPFGESHSHG